MRYSRFFGKTTRGDQKDSKFISHQLLTKAGFIRESTAGRYYYLPLGWRVHEKIKAIIKDEMDKAGCQEMITPLLHPVSLWRETARTDSVGFELMTVKDRSDAQFVLGGTAEEMFVDLIRKFPLSYRDLPFTLYQFSTKFRDELRARGGLLRVREFVMKDAYSFDKNAEDFKPRYESLAAAYHAVFRRVGLSAEQVEADNGYIGGDYCHEFIVESEVGESRYFVSEDGIYCAHEDVARFKRQEMNPDEEIKPFQIIAQPEWVQTMDDNVKHYSQPRWRYLKNVVYRNTLTGEIIIGGIRGDLEVNKTKLEQALDAVGLLEDATDEDLRRLGTKSGYVHSWGHQGARYIGDLSLTTVRNFIGGQKETESDSFNVNYGRDFACEKLADIAMAQNGDLTEDSRQHLTEKRGIEVGNIFQLGYHYSSKMQGAVYVDQDGKEKPLYMGCYGIGVGRTLAAVVEKHHDSKGILWPEAIAPFRVHLVSLAGSDARAEQVYEKLLSARIDVLWDDRAEAAGVKFNDADLIGIPVRLVVSERNGEKIEWKRRDATSAELLDMDEVVQRLKS
jgi:prolyl-tRNA synthetase